jgi:foldase protein PrsA
MKPTRIAFALVLVLFGAFLAAGCGGSDQSVPNDAVAVVDGTEITKADLDALLGRAKKSYVAQKRDFPKVGTADYQSLQTQAVAYLVQRAEYAREAEKLGVEVTDKEVDARVAEVKKTYFDNDQKKLDKQLATQGYTAATFRDDIQAQLVSEKLYDKVTTGNTVSDADAQKYYDENIAQFKTGETREVRHILIAVNKEGQNVSEVKTGGDTVVDFDKSRPIADKVYEQLAAGADFATLAKKESQDTGSKAAGGKLTIAKGQTVAAFDKTAFLLKVNQISKPVKTEYGYHVIEPVGEVKPATTTPFAKVKASIKAQLVETKKNEAIQKWADETKASWDKKVSYGEGYAPPVTSTSSSTTTTG